MPIVFITARDMAKGRQVVDNLKKTTGNDKIDVLELDLTSLQSDPKFRGQLSTAP